MPMCSRESLRPELPMAFSFFALSPNAEDDERRLSRSPCKPPSRQSNGSTENRCPRRRMPLPLPLSSLQCLFQKDGTSAECCRFLPAQSARVVSLMPISYLPLVTRTIAIMSTGIPIKKPTSHLAPAGLPRFIVQPIDGMDFGTHVRLSRLLK